MLRLKRRLNGRGVGNLRIEDLKVSVDGWAMFNTCLELSTKNKNVRNAKTLTKDKKKKQVKKKL